MLSPPGSLRGTASRWRCVDVAGHYGDTIVRARYDGDYDKTNLPGELIMTSYFSVRDGKIVSQIVVRNQPSPY